MRLALAVLAAVLMAAAPPLECKKGTQPSPDATFCAPIVKEKRPKMTEAERRERSRINVRLRRHFEERERR